MDRSDKEQWVKIICYGVAALIAYHILIGLFPYVVGFFAILGVGYVFHEYQKHRRR